MIKLNEKTLAQLCLAAAAKYGEKPAFSLLSEEKIERTITYAQFGIRARQLGSLLRQFGIGNGDRVLLLSENCPEWPVTYFGIAMAGAVSVPLLTGFSEEQIQHIASHAGISAICLSRSMIERCQKQEILGSF